MKGYLWKTNILGQEGYAVTTDQVVNENTVFHFVNSRPGEGERPGWGAQVYQTLDTIGLNVLEKGLEIEKVDYNRAPKNTVVLKAICDFTNRYWYEGRVAFEVEYASNDFVPNSPGATYEFRCPWGTEKFVVGQTYHFENLYYVEDGDYTFNGKFGVSNLRDTGNYKDVFIFPGEGTPKTWAVGERDGMFYTNIISEAQPL